MKSRTSLADHLFAMALSLESGGGETFVLMQSAERLDTLESRIRDLQQVALYLRTTLADVSATLAGLQIGTQNIDNPSAEAAIKAAAAVRAVANFDLGG